MSALKDYRNLLDDARNTYTGKLHIHPRHAIEAADAAIAELEYRLSYVEDERNHLSEMLEIAAEDEWSDSDTVDTLDDYSETWLICLGERADKKEQK